MSKLILLLSISIVFAISVSSGKECSSHGDCPEACYLNKKIPTCGSWLDWKDRHFPSGKECSPDIDCPEVCFMTRTPPSCGLWLNLQDELFEIGKPCSSNEDCPELCTGKCGPWLPLGKPIKPQLK